MDKKRSFTELKKKMSYNEFNNFCRKITEEYANSETRFARSYFCNQHNISQSCFYRILEHAVVTNLVDEMTFSKMLEKSRANQKAHSSNAGGSSNIKFARMYRERCKFIVMSIQPEEVKKIAEEFSKKPYRPKADLARKNGMPAKAFDYLLLRAIEEDIVDDKIFAKIQTRSLSKTEPDKLEYTKDFFAGLQKKRIAFRNKVNLQ